ncbi:hypothetical protein HK097_008024 [Rhizophlyctis rosea]|uniref:RRM domain-containing protein n=1 Tax=Rhizophlyctis rosea TaxID=64517 RepID=A0AAD5SAV7_9FUNG|nr:hypothetical protein HK097_008024 [Rhizophlyctis rosea]
MTVSDGQRTPPREDNEDQQFDEFDNGNENGMDSPRNDDNQDTEMDTGEDKQPVVKSEYRDNERRSPRRDSRERQRSRSPGRGKRDDEDRGRSGSYDPNPGHNLFVTGLSHRTKDEDLEKEFSKYGKISKCAIMYDPHTRESRGFAFVSFENVEAADEALEHINRQLELHGRILTVARAKRTRARTPTPGRYHGPPKRDDDRYDSRASSGSYRGRPDRYSDRRYDDRDRRGGYDRRYDDRDRYDRRRSPRR